MYLKMVVGSSLDDLPIYAKFYKYAKSYLKSARNLCKIMEIEKDYENEIRKYPLFYIIARKVD